MVKNKLLAILLCIPLLLTAAVTAHADGADEGYTVAQVESLRDGIVAYYGASGGQDFADGRLTDNAGTTAEFCAIALSQSGSFDLSRYEAALLNYLGTHEVYSAASREKYALALAAAGSTDRYIADTADEAIGGLGLMSLVFGLHLLNNGYSSSQYSTDGLITEILSRQTDDGGWAVIGSYGDVDVTAMTIQALAPYYGGRGDLTAAVDRGIDLLSRKQLDSGGFKTMGAENCESAAQVIIALSALSIDAQTDARFLKNGCSAMTGMMQYSLGDGSFSHTGGGTNESATIEAYCALTAYLRYCYGQGSLYLLDHVRHPSPEEIQPEKPQPDGGASSGRSSDVSGGSDSRQNGSSSNSGADHRSDTAAQAETDASGSRIVVIDGRRYVEATTASGEVMTVFTGETVPPDDPQNSSGYAKPTHGAFQSASTADEGIKKASPDETGGKSGYKLWAILGILAAAGVACAVLFLLKKRGKKHFIAVGVIAAAGVLFVLLTNFKSADSALRPVKTDGEITVTLSIRCDTITGLKKVNYYVPDDGVILETQTYYADEGDTVYDVLMQAVSEHHIAVDNRGAQGAAYIAGINSLYEFDYGDLSGWMYRVNGAFPDVGCQSCTVSDGDVIEWLYTTEIGRDLG